MSRRATLCFILSLLRLAVAQRGVFEPFVELTEEIPRTPAEDSHTPALDNFRGAAGPGLGFGGACTHDAQCADGLVCISNAECSHGNPNAQCVDFLCYCPLPFVLTEDRRCLAPPGYGQVAAVVTPIVMLSLAALLGIGYLYHRVYRDSWVPAEPHVVAVPSSASIPRVVTRPTQPKPRYIRGLPAADTRPFSPQLANSATEDNPQNERAVGGVNRWDSGCFRISSAEDGQSTAAGSPASPTNPPVSYTCVEGSLFAVPPWLAGGANDGVSVSVRSGSRVLLEGEASPRRSRTASSVDDSFMRELKERLRLKALLRLREWRRERAEARVNPPERTDDATSTVPPSRQTPATETGQSVESPAARTPAADLQMASESATPSPVFEGRKSGTRSSDRPRLLSALSQTSRREDPLEPVAEEEPADSDGAVSSSEASSINSLCCPEDYEESVRHTVALGWDMPAAVVVATTPPESPCSDPHLSVQVPASADDSPAVSSPVDVAPAFLAAGGNSSAFEAASQSSPAHTNADESRAISQDTVAPVLHGARASLESPMARTACAGDTWTPESALVLPSPASCSSHYVTPLPIRSRPKGTDIQMSRRSSAVQTEECSSISRATTAKMEDSFCEEYGRGSQMMRVLFAGNAHYLRERSDTFRRASTLDETLYICQQIGQQQDPPMPPRPATAASEVFVTRSTTALGSSCEDREPLRLRHLVGLQHPHAYLMANRRRTPIGSHSPSGDEGVNRSSPQLRPMPRPRRLLAVNAEPTGRASDPVVVSESPPRPKPRTRLPLRVPLSLSSTSERHSDSSVLLMPDSTELDWSTTPSTPR
ncbi:hypothetical protein HPB50_001363 [Hyalomma asiaticum]|uniref:Uncharacterized protein n=1 Tax=Hyalomma asiaticum TaxID=266040 RepID=A0ACB7RR44_HYAAI|nr:hypothetical protein HPB50_001363 [Hyalomma asiaticum]